MEDLINYSYQFERVDDNPLNIKYDFVSVGEKEVPKRVILMKYGLEGLEKFYNLGFGNISISAAGEEIISDMTRDNNRNDTENVLKTVFTCALDHLSNNNESVLTFYGNTTAKHRLYKMQLNKHLNTLKSSLKVKGGIINGIVIEENEGGKRPANQLTKDQLDQIEYEDYTPERSRYYNFITFELIDDLKDEIDVDKLD